MEKEEEIGEKLEIDQSPKSIKVIKDALLSTLSEIPILAALPRFIEKMEVDARFDSVQKQIDFLFDSLILNKNNPISEVVWGLLNGSATFTPIIELLKPGSG